MLGSILTESRRVIDAGRTETELFWNQVLHSRKRTPSSLLQPVFSKLIFKANSRDTHSFQRFLGKKEKHWYPIIVSCSGTPFGLAEKEAREKTMHVFPDTSMFAQMLVPAGASKRREDDWRLKTRGENGRSIAEVDLMVCILPSKYPVLLFWCPFFLENSISHSRYPDKALRMTMSEWIAQEEKAAVDWMQGRKIGCGWYHRT